jgi:CspA family cold shock protein
MTTGTIKKVVADRGFGFIAASDEKEYFFHRGALDTSLDFDRLVGGEQVTFEIEASPKGRPRCDPPSPFHGPPSRRAQRPASRAGSPSRS